MSKGFLLIISVVFGCGCEMFQRQTVIDDNTPPSESLPKEAQYWKLQAKTFDEMVELIKERQEEADQEIEENPNGAKILLREVIEIILARPNSDNMTTQLIASPRSNLRNINAYEEVLQIIGDNATRLVKDSTRAPSERATAIILLENLMTEVRPEAASNKKITEIFKAIAEAKIQIDSQTAAHLRRRAMMKKPPSPSAIASSVLSSIQPKPHH